MKRFFSAIMLVFLISMPVMAEEKPLPETLASAFAKLSDDLEILDPAFSDQRSTLFLHAEMEGKLTAPLAALIEREAMLALSRKTNFKHILTTGNLPFAYPGIDEITLARLDHFGVDRVLDIAAALKGKQLLIRVRAMWLDGGSWAPVLEDEFSYPQQLLRVAIAASQTWEMLGRPIEEVQSVSFNWQREESFSTPGRVLDMATGDLDGDGRTDLLLLFDEHIEIWRRGEAGFDFLYTHDLSQDGVPQVSVRWMTGELAFCRIESNPSLHILAATNAMKGGLRFFWDGRRLVESSRLAGAPLVCNKGRVAMGEYRMGAHVFELDIREYSSRHTPEKPIPTPTPFLSALPLPDGEGWILLGSEGELQLLSNKGKSRPLGINCGIHPVLLADRGSPLLVCGRAITDGTRDRLTLWRLTMNGPVLSAELEELPGLVYAITADSSVESEAIFAGRYIDSENLTHIDRYYR